MSGIGGDASATGQSERVAQKIPINFEGGISTHSKAEEQEKVSSVDK